MSESLPSSDAPLPAAPAPTRDQELLLTIARAWDRVLGDIESGLSHIKGITFAEYRLLRAIAEAPGGTSSRVDLAERVRLSPSGVTRALQPLEKLGFVETRRGARDARLALAVLTPAGTELLADASVVVDDVAAGILERTPGLAAERGGFLGLLEELISVG